MFGRPAATGYSTREKECYSALLLQAVDLDPFIRSLVMWCIRVKIDRCGARDEDFGTFICNDWTTNQYFYRKKVKFFLHVGVALSKTMIHTVNIILIFFGN